MCNYGPGGNSRFNNVGQPIYNVGSVPGSDCEHNDNGLCVASADLIGASSGSPSPAPGQSPTPAPTEGPTPAPSPPSPAPESGPGPEEAQSPTPAPTPSNDSGD